MENTPSKRYPVKVTPVRSLTLSLFFAAFTAAQTPPPTPVHPVTETLHGVAVTDPYRWLEDQNSPETRAWLDAEIGYTQAYSGTRENRAAAHATHSHRLVWDTHRASRALLLQQAAGK
jgi:prolyl oligopeptidase